MTIIACTIIIKEYALSLKRVIIVEDEIKLANALMELLEDSFDNLDVSIAENGEDAFQLIIKEEFDLIISDHRMPKMLGADFIKLTRMDDNSLNKETPVIFLSGFILEAKTAIKEYEDIIYLDKPFREDSIIRNAKILMGKQEIQYKKSS